MSQQQETYQVSISKAWTQGRTVFGGMTAALCYQAAQNLVTDGRPPRAFHCNFVGPVNYDAPVLVTAEILRTGKNVTQIVAKVMQGEDVCVMAQVCFGVNRASVLHLEDQKTHNFKLPRKGNFIPQIPKLVPKFIQNFELAVEKGNLALGKSDEAVLNGWSKLKVPPHNMSIAALIAIMDAWPPTMFQLMRLPSPASTMSWDLEFIAPHKYTDGSQWIASVNEATHVADGYGHEQSTFWTAEGEVLAYSRQVVTIFA